MSPGIHPAHPDPGDTAWPESTLRYVRENEHAFSLPRESYTAVEKSRQMRSTSVVGILRDRFGQITIGSLRYLYAIAREFVQISKLSALKSAKAGRRALVLGNGPSLGYLSSEQLRRFQHGGGEFFSVNFWTTTHLGGVAPDYQVISDGATLAAPESRFGSRLSDELRRKNALLAAFLRENERVKIACPLARVRELVEQFGSDRIIGFVDHEMRALTSNIDPRFPRGYASLTLFKALALAIFLGYEEICVLGMDNTFPRDTFCDFDNRIYRLERHAGAKDTIFDQSAVYPTMDVWAQDMLDLFSDLHRCFKGSPVLNLDPYSLTDAFRKIDSMASFEVGLGISAENFTNRGQSNPPAEKRNND